MKLIKINTDHYVIVDDSVIKEGDYLYSFSNNKVVVANKLTDLYVHSKKITHSTQPLGKPMLFTNAFESDLAISTMELHETVIENWGCKKLSLQEVKELIGEVDVEKKIISPYPVNTQNDVDWCNGYQRGYNQALEDNKDKKYTEQDMKYMFECGRNYQNNAEVTFKMSMEYLQQTKTEWEVEFVDGKLKLV